MSNGQNAANLLALLTTAASLAPTVATLINTAKVAVSEGRDLTREEAQAAIADDDAARATFEQTIASMPD